MNGSHSGTSTKSGSAQDSLNLDEVFNPPTREEWLATALAGLPNHDSLHTLAKQTIEGLSIDVLYDGIGHPSDAFQMQTDIQADAWDNRQSILHDENAETLNTQILKDLLEGYSSIELNATGDSDYTTIFSGVNLALIKISLRADDQYKQAADSFIQFAKSSTSNADQLQCSFNADPVGTWIKNNNGRPNSEAFASMAKFAKNICTALPHASSIVVDVTQHHNAGASAKQELVAAIATGSLYLEALLDAGMSMDNASQCISFQLSCDADVLLNVVKLRSLDQLWNHLVHEFGAMNSEQELRGRVSTRTVVETSKRFLSKMDHWNNHLRNIAASTAAALGNASAIIVHPHDQIEGWMASDDPSIGKRVAKNLAIILDRECGLTRVGDPLSGSFAVESLTQDLTELAWSSLKEYETAQSWLDSVENGQWQRALSESHQKRTALLESAEAIMVGVNRYKSNSEPMSMPNDESENLDSPTMRGSQITSLLQPVRDSASFEREGLHRHSSPKGERA